MASMIDRGDSYRVAYLGSAQLQQMATGLGVLQKPLRELYIKARKPGSSSQLQQRQLTMTRDGMRMSYKNKPNAPLQEDFYAVPFILLWDAVRFVMVQSHDKKDKRPRCAFEPLDNDHSRNKDNLFLPLDKKYKFLAQQQHGAIFACVLRRTKGVKALDIHAFMCASDEEALGLVRALNMVHSGYSSDQATETGVFGYSPFGKSTVRVAAGDVAQFAKTPPSVRRTTYEPRAVTPRSNMQAAHKQQQHVRNVFQHTPAANSAPHHIGANQLAQQRRVFHLSQEDLLAPQLQISPGFEDFDIDTPGRSQLAEAEYEYVGTIRKNEVKKLTENDSPCVKLRQKGAASGRSEPRLSHRHSIHDTHNLSPHHSPPNPYPFQNQPRGKAGLTPSGAQESQHSAAKLGQGYGLLSGSGDGSVDAISITSRAHEPSSRPITVSVAQSRQLFRDLQEFQSRQEEGNSAHSRGPLMRPPKSPGYQDTPPNIGRSLDNVSHMDTSLYVNANDPMLDRSRDREPEKEATPPPPPRQKPIARVPPHMKTGVRVLPENFSIPPPRHTDDKKSKADRPKSGLFSKNNTAPNDRPASGLFMKSPTGTFPDNASVSSGRSKSQTSLVHQDITVGRSDAGEPENWQFGSKNREDKYKQTVKSNLNEGQVDRKMGEKLLMSKKKDAEIASVMQNLKLDYRDMPTLTPGAPSGLNFEKSLGYFP